MSNMTTQFNEAGLIKAKTKVTNSSAGGAHGCVCDPQASGFGKTRKLEVRYSLLCILLLFSAVLMKGFRKDSAPASALTCRRLCDCRLNFLCLTKDTTTPCQTQTMTPDCHKSTLHQQKQLQISYSINCTFGFL